MASIVFQLAAVCVLAAAAQAHNNACDVNPCGITYGREVQTQEIYVQPGLEFYISPPRDICGLGIEPLGFTSKACAADKTPEQDCAAPLQEVLRRTGNPNALLTLKLTVYCPIVGHGEVCTHCPVISTRGQNTGCPYCSQRARPGPGPIRRPVDMRIVRPMDHDHHRAD